MALHGLDAYLNSLVQVLNWIKYASYIDGRENFRVVFSDFQFEISMQVDEVDAANRISSKQIKISFYLWSAELM